jgi:SAM-dependent methyltransferase
MNPRLQTIQKLLRDLRLLHVADKCRFMARRVKLYKKNREFIRNHPEFELPPEELVFDAHGNIDWNFYYESGKSLSERISKEIKANYKGPVRCIVEWGCGPGRVIRHLAEQFPDVRIIGTDYNNNTINWCKANIANVLFIGNDLNPPLMIEANSVDALYAISVFTHLSEQICIRWINELKRILKPGGILLVWTNGDYISNFLLREELAAYRNSTFVLRDKYEEGKKMFLSFHPPKWVRETLLSDFEIIKHYSGGFSAQEQDVWICRKDV